jgi:carbamoyl-phosphate synthase small subunit
MSIIRHKRQALLVLEDGSVYHGHAFAGSGETLGEVVFNTGMTGYQEVITDPSYRGQIVTMTYPLIGNYGINPEDMESGGIHLEGFIVKEYQPCPSNWRSRQSLKAFLECHGKLGVEGIDTRALTRRIRLEGAMRGILSTETQDIDLLLDRVRAYPGLVGQDLIKEVTCKRPYLWKDGAPQPLLSPVLPKAHVGEGTRRLRVVVVDCGVKYNILRNLEKLGCEVLVFPRLQRERIFYHTARMVSCSPTGRGIRQRCPISLKRRSTSSEKFLSSVSVLDIRFWDRPSGGEQRS